MNNKSLVDLRKVMKIEGIDWKSGRDAREEALNEWINEWIVEVETSQSIIKSSLTSEEDDFLKYHLATQIGDRLMDDCIAVKVTKNKITTKIRALKR